MTKEKIFVSAYACEPGLGSEIGVGWHWVLEMSKYYDLWVLTRESNRHTIEPWIAEHPEFGGIKFLYYDWPKWARFWKRGMQGVRLYYNIWQLCTNKIVKRTMRDNDIQIFHHLTYGNAVWPVSRYGRKHCFIWGPVSAGVMIPKDFTKHYRLAGRCKEAIQRLVARTLPYNIGFRTRCKDANLILCKTSDTIEFVPAKFRNKCIQFTDVAVEPIMRTDNKFSRTDNVINYMAAGTLVGWRNFDVLILAFSKACEKNNNLRLKIVGGGDEYEKLSLMIKELKLERYIKLTGQLKMKEYYDEMANADVIINPCFREGAVTVSFDSMNFAKPLICFDTKGYTNYFKDDYSFIIKGVKTRKEAIDRLTDGIIYLSDKERIMDYGNKAYLASKQFDWEHKGRRIRDVIEKCYKGYAGQSY